MSVKDNPESGASLLVAGASGQVGWELVRRAAAQGVRVQGLSREALDITDAAAVHEAVIDSRPSVVINAAAYTAVDKAESEPDSAYAVNRDGAGNIARACAHAGVPLIHISTDYVFSGDKETPYCEDDPVHPLNVYGASKAAGEALVRQYSSTHLILRTSWVYGVHGRNFVKTILKAAREKSELRVVADQRGCPTAAGDIAEVVLWLVARIGASPKDMQWGTYHYSGLGVTTWHGFAEAIVKFAGDFPGHSVTVIPITTAEYPVAARRPANSVLGCSRIETAFHVRRRPWQYALREVVAVLINAGE
jgi:dTDP-4-dehydrorhamnose reductase